MRFLKIFLIFFSAQSFAQSITHLQGFAYALNETGNVSLARGQKLSNFEQLNIPAQSQIQIEWSESSTLEIIGPARMSYRNNIFYLEQGRFLFFSLGRFPQRFNLFNENFRPSNTVFELEIPSHRTHAQILILDGDFYIQGETLSTQNLYMLENNRLQKGPLNPSFTEERKKDYKYSSLNFRKIEDRDSLFSLRNQIIVAQHSSLIQLGPQTTQQNFVQNTLGFGFSVEWAHKRYLKLPKRPQRIHFLRAPAFILGTGVFYETNKIQASDFVTENSQFLGAHLSAGFSWMGLALTANGAYVSGENTFYKMTSPYSYGVKARYEWDLLDFSATDILFSLGYGYSVSKLQSKPELIALPTPTRFNFVQHTLLLGFHLNF
jgi:hypothetical protein